MLLEEQPHIHRNTHSKQRLSKPYSLSFLTKAKVRYRRIGWLADKHYKPLDSLITLQKFLIGRTGCVLFAALIIHDIRYTISMEDPGRDDTIAVIPEARDKAIQPQGAVEDPDGIIPKDRENQQTLK